jgi:hypothetical protein
LIDIRTNREDYVIPRRDTIEDHAGKIDLGATWFHFQTYRLSGSEWGYELVRAEGHSCSTVSDPNWSSERAVIEAIHGHVENLEHVPGYGWCVVMENEKSALGMRR